MTQYKGALIAFMLTIFLLIIPSFFILENALTQFYFLKVNGEVNELIKEEGGYSPKVATLINKLNTNGFTITMNKENGQPVTTTLNAGETVIVNYKYKYTGIQQVQEFELSDSILIRKR